MSDSYQDKLSRVRKPRVQITYDVETEGGQVKKELPFVVGVMGDFSGNPTAPLKPLAERSFVQVDRDNFDQVLAGMNPGLELKVENTIEGEGKEMSVNLEFKKMEDFEPGRVAEQIEPVKKLLEAREKLKELQATVDRSPELENVLENILQNEGDIGKLAGELGGGDAPAEGEGASEGGDES